MSLTTVVTNLSTLEQRVYTCTAEEAVVAAYRQEMGDWNTWDYNRKKELITRTDRTVACGDWCALLPPRNSLNVIDVLFSTGSLLGSNSISTRTIVASNVEVANISSREDVEDLLLSLGIKDIQDFRATIKGIVYPWRSPRSQATWMDLKFEEEIEGLEEEGDS